MSDDLKDEQQEGAPQFEKADRVFHQKVLDELMKIIQEEVCVLTTERNAVDHLKSLLRRMIVAEHIVELHEEYLGPLCEPGESNEDFMKRISKGLRVLLNKEIK